jgi:hypothetical protein
MGGAHAFAHLWDNGQTAARELDQVLQIRELAINNFSVDNIRTNEPNSVLEDVFVPLYFFHRYQTEAASKVIGGLNYNYAVKGDGQTTVEIVNKNIQREALNSLLKTLDAQTIALPREKLALFPPRAIGYDKTRESFKGKTGVAFDALSAAETAADMTLEFILHPERASRLIQQKSLEFQNLGLEEVLKQIVENTIKNKQKDDYYNEVQTVINFRVLFHIMNLAVHKEVHPQVNAIATAELGALKTYLEPLGELYAAEMNRRIDNFLKEPDEFEVIPPPKIPDGSPIGMACME